MDRISALRNVEDALAAFEDGEISLEELERRVRTVLRTYATEFGTDAEAAYRVTATDPERSVVVVAASPGGARERARAVADLDPVAVERVSPPERADE